MGSNSKIEWTDATWNPIRGCTKVSPACAHCYAETLAKRNPTVLGTWGPKGQRVIGSEDHWKRPVRWAKAHLKAVRARLRFGDPPSSVRPLRIFTASLGDVFEDHPIVEQVRDRIWKETIPALEALRLPDGRPAAVLLLLTKRPRIMAEWAAERGWSEVCWAGTTVEDQRRADERIPWLLRVSARVRFLSVEPMLSAVDLTDIRGDFGSVDCLREMDAGDWSGHGLSDWRQHAISWVICGGESGPGARPMHPAWARKLRDQCVEAGVPFLFKQWGAWGWRAARRPAQAGQRTHTFHDGETLHRVGKKAAGRLLDGRTWDEVPRG